MNDSLGSIDRNGLERGDITAGRASNKQFKEISENRKEAIVKKYEWSVRQKLMLDDEHNIG